MANKKISELPYINVSEISGNTLVPLVTYFSAATGDTVHTYANDLKSFITSGISVSGNFLPLSGGTVSGGTQFTVGLTANTISATTYQNLPPTTFSGGTVTGPTNFTNGLTANTISATTYQNLPTDIRVTGGTYSAGTISFTNNTGGTFSVTGLTTGSTSTVSGNFLPLSGGTVTGSTIFTSGLTANTLNVTGLTQTKGITSTGGITFKQVTVNSTYSATTEDYMIDVSGGTFSVYLPSAIGLQGRLINIKNNGGGAVTIQPILNQTIDDKLFIILGETNALQLVSNGSNWVALGYNISTVNTSTGVFEFTGITTASTTTFTVAPVKGWIVDNTTNPLSPQLYYVSFTGGTYSSTYVTTDSETYVYLTSGGTVSQSNIQLTEQQRRQNIFLGKLSHPNKISITNVFNQPDYTLSPLSQLRDMFTPIKLINGGIRTSANGVNLSFNTSAGYLYGLGINFINDTLNPDSLYVSGTSPCTFQYRTQTGGTTSNVTLIDPTKYDVGGVVTALPGTKATNQRIYLLQNGEFRVQYGQVSYNTLALAAAGLANEQFVEFSNLTSTGILIGILSVLSTATDLSDSTKALFFNVSKFGDSSGAAGGTPTTNLQQAYNNSINPEIITNSTLDGLQIRGGTGNDNDKNFIIENNSGVQTAWISASGDSYFNTVTATTISAYTITTEILNLNTGYTGTTLVGSINWNGDFGVPEVGMIGGNVVQKIGESVYAYVRNAEANTLNKGEVVYIFGATGDKISVKRASNTGDTTSSKTLGVVAENIISGDLGYVITQGTLDGLNLGMYTAGDILWLSSTPGQFTNIKQYSPYHLVFVGVVQRANAGNGQLYVKPQNGYELEELHNVMSTGATFGDILTYSAFNGNNVWVSTKTLNGSYTITGNTSIGGSLTATTISATTYQNLPTDVRVTGATYSNNTFTHTNNTGGTYSVLFNTVTGLTVNGNLTVTGNTNVMAFTGRTGYISGSGQSILTVIGSGNSTTSPLFTVQGSSGELFSVNDSLVGSLFSVNDISGLPILEVFSDNTTLMGSYQAPSLNTTTKVTLTAGTNTVYSIPTSAYTGAFIDYTLVSTGTTGARAGNIMTIWSGTTAQYTETSTNDIGTTTGVTFSVAVSGNNAVLSSSATTSGWTLKTIVRSI